MLQYGVFRSAVFLGPKLFIFWKKRGCFSESGLFSELTLTRTPLNHTQEVLPLGGCYSMFELTEKRPSYWGPLETASFQSLRERESLLYISAQQAIIHVEISLCWHNNYYFVCSHFYVSLLVQTHTQRSYWWTRRMVCHHRRTLMMRGLRSSAGLSPMTTNDSTH